MKRLFLLLAVLVTGLSSCANTYSSDDNSNKDPCESIGKLLVSYQNQFADIRGSRRSFDRISIWSTNYQLVGSGCEIWGWQGGKYNYVCNYVAPDEESARSIYREAASKIGACASEEWQLKQRDTQEGAGAQSVWQQPDLGAVVDLKLVQTRGIGKPRWAIYLLIGDFNSQL